MGQTKRPRLIKPPNTTTPPVVVDEQPAIEDNRPAKDDVEQSAFPPKDREYRLAVRRTTFQILQANTGLGNLAAPVEQSWTLRKW